MTIPVGTRLGASEIPDAVWQWRQRFLPVLIDRDGGTPSAILYRAELPGSPDTDIVRPVTKPKSREGGFRLATPSG